MPQQLDDGSVFDDDPEHFDPDRLVGCAYWRCGDIFEQRTANHQFCRKACRSRQRKWERSQARKQAKAAAKQARQATKPTAS